MYVIPALGWAAERKVGDAAVLSLAWSADSRSLVISRSPAAAQRPGLSMLSIETGELSQLTSPGAPHFDRLAAMAPSGDAIAFKRSAAPTDFGSLMLLSLPRSPQPARALEAIGIDKRWSVTTFAWSADGREIIYSAGSGVSFLWRIAVSGDSQPERLSFAGEGACDPAIARSGSRLVFSRSLAETNIWSLALDDAGRAKGQAVRVFDSSMMERCPAFSPDGIQSRVRVESFRQHGSVGLPEQRFGLFTADALPRITRGKPGVVSRSR